MSNVNLIDNETAIAKLVDIIVTANPKPLLFIDIEGIYLSRHGSVSIVQLLVPHSPKVHLIDVHTLQAAAFTTKGKNGWSFKNVLECDQLVKVFFDVRNDSDALFAHYKVNLKSVVDLQLMNLAVIGGAPLLTSLGKCIASSSNMTPEERVKSVAVKEAGLRLLAPEKGGKYEVFNERPMPKAIQDYCVQDVLVLPSLLVDYACRAKPHVVMQVLEETRQRITKSQASNYNGKGQHMAIAPKLNFKQ